MSFEKEVLSKVAEIVKSEDLATFFFGTLSVICTEAESRKILKQLNKDYNNKVQVSRDGSYGYNFDFVA
jgi:uncharacterized protein (DUF488 family)